MKDNIYLAVIVGIRSQFMKLVSLQKSIHDWNRSFSPKIDATYINTGQHYDDELAGAFIKELGVDIDVDLTGSYEDLRSVSIFSSMILKLTEVIESKNQLLDWVIIFGDANTTAAGAIAVARLGIPIIHIEAGVRTGDRKSPEEINRILSDHLSSVHMVSSKIDIANLADEGIIEHVVWTGDLIGDLVLRLSGEISSGFDSNLPGEYILASLHRDENLKADHILRNLITELNSYKKKVVFITHPRTRERIDELGLNNLNNIQFVGSLSYKKTLAAINGCYFLVTDSGAFQREAYYLRKHCLVRQEHAFWSTLIDLGAHRTIGISCDEIREGFRWIEQMVDQIYPTFEDLGDGQAGMRILKAIVDLSQKSNTDKSD